MATDRKTLERKAEALTAINPTQCTAQSQLIWITNAYNALCDFKQLLKEIKNEAKEKTSSTI